MQITLRKFSVITLKWTRNSTMRHITLKPKRPTASLTCSSMLRDTGWHAFLPSLVRARSVRLGCDAHQRQKYAGLQGTGARRGRDDHSGTMLGLKVAKDLIVDMEPFFDNYKKVLPYFINDSPLPADGRERLQSPEQRARFDDTTKCILCAACTTSCPSYWGSDEYLRSGRAGGRPPFYLRQPR